MKQTAVMVLASLDQIAITYLKLQVISTILSNIYLLLNKTIF